MKPFVVRSITVVLALGILGGRPDRSAAQPSAPRTPTVAVERAPHADPGNEVTFADVDSATVRVVVFSRVSAEVFRSTPAVHFAAVNSGHGSGFAIGSDGLVVTAYHVIEDADAIVVYPPGDGARPITARVVATRRDDDLALLDVAQSLAGIELAESGRLSVRQTVFAIGYPIDGTRSTPQSSRGIVSGQLDDGRVQLDIAVNPGNSGGPVIDETNHVVGVVSARGDLAAGVQGIGIAIPIGEVRALLSAERSVASLPAGDEHIGDDVQRIWDAMELANVDGLLETIDRTSYERVQVDVNALFAALANLSSRAGRVYASAMLWNLGILVMVNSRGDLLPRYVAPEARANGLRLLDASSLLASRLLADAPEYRTRHPFLVTAAGRSIQRLFPLVTPPPRATLDEELHPPDSSRRRRRRH